MQEDDSISAETLSLDTLASIRSLIINADTYDSVISSVFDFFTGLVNRGDSAILHHVLKLLSDFAFWRKEYALQIFDAVLSNFLRLQNTSAEASHRRVAVESLAVLASLSESNRSIATALSKIDGEVFASICLGAPVSSRLWLLRNAERFNVPSSVLFTLSLGFTKDPYPYIRKVALDELISICKASNFDHANAPLSNKQSITSIPPLAFSYSLAMLGKFSCGLHDMMDQDTLLAYLTHCTIISASSGTEFNKGDTFFHAYRHGNGDLAGNPVLLPSKDTPAERTHLASVAELESRNQALTLVNHILLKIKAAWLLSQSGCSKEAFRAYRACKQELAALSADTSISDGALKFMCQYVDVIELLAQVWPHFKYSGYISTCRSVELELLMEVVDRKLMEIRCRFTGLSKEESLVMELVIFACLLGQYSFEICSRLSCMEKLSSTMSQLELHHEQQCTKPSDFLTETKKSLQEIGSSADINCCRVLDLIKRFNCFSSEQFTFSANLHCISAELEVPGNGPYSPISFVPGLPVAIPCEITLLNVPRDTYLWLGIARNNDTCQFVYLDPILYNRDGREKKFMFSAVTYMTPRAVVFTYQISIGIECLFEDNCYRKRSRGPKHQVAYLCKEREVHLSLVTRT